jgi:uncharacterized membrane protein YsdA (DUF1294 family)
MQLLYFYFLATTVISFILVGYDKYLARNKKRRITENSLLLWPFFGGSLGTGFAMWVFKHKTSKRSFLWKFWSIVLLQFLVVLTLFYTDSIGVFIDKLFC